MTENLVAWIALVIAVFSSLWSWLSLRQSNNIHESTVFLRFRDKYSEHEMKTAMEILIDWWMKGGEEKLADWNQQRRKREAGAMELDKARRTIKSYYFPVAQLYRDRFISRKLARILINNSGLRVLYSIVQPMEKVMDPGRTSNAHFKVLTRIVPERNVEGFIDA